MKLRSVLVVALGSVVMCVAWVPLSMGLARGSPRGWGPDQLSAAQGLALVPLVLVIGALVLGLGWLEPAASRLRGAGRGGAVGALVAAIGASVSVVPGLCLAAHAPLDVALATGATGTDVLQRVLARVVVDAVAWPYLALFQAVLAGAALGTLAGLLPPERSGPSDRVARPALLLPAALALVGTLTALGSIAALTMLIQRIDELSEPWLAERAALLPPALVAATPRPHPLETQLVLLLPLTFGGLVAGLGLGWLWRNLVRLRGQPGWPRRIGRGLLALVTIAPYLLVLLGSLRFAATLAVPLALCALPALLAWRQPPVLPLPPRLYSEGVALALGLTGALLGCGAVPFFGSAVSLALGVIPAIAWLVGGGELPFASMADRSSLLVGVHAVLVAQVVAVGVACWLLAPVGPWLGAARREAR